MPRAAKAAAMAVAGAAVLIALVLLHRGRPIGWDELEYFRATKWTSEGRLPFRDFWEHHTPLQWLLFAPVARLIDSPGTSAVVALRWAQAVVWAAILALVLRLTRDRARWWALALLLASPLFVHSAVEYRVDVLGHLAFVAALLAAFRRRWIAYGALMSAAVLANMRLAPLVVITSAVMLFWSEERWRWNVPALRMAAGVAAVAVPFLGLLQLAGALQPFLLGVVRYNIISSELFKELGADTLADQLLLPVTHRDAAAIVLWLAAIAGCVLALRAFRTPRAPQLLAIIFIASVVTVAMLEVQYEYHWLASYLLKVPLASMALERIGRWWWLAPAAAIASMAAQFPMKSEGMRYQDYVMREVDRRTLPRERVFDGSAYALRREPAYRYWFLPIGIRQLAERGSISRYDITEAPPAAVIYNLRLQRWFEIFPRTAAFATHNYVPVTRNLWLPGLSVKLPPGQTVTWTAHRAGAYTLYASEPLARHPWLTDPLGYAAVQGPLATRFAIPLRQLPPARVRWSVDGVVVEGTSVNVRNGSRVEIVSGEARTIGIVVVPSDVTVLCVAPGEEFQF
jgi:hypothetical protein